MSKLSERIYKKIFEPLYRKFEDRNTIGYLLARSEDLLDRILNFARERKEHWLSGMHDDSLTDMIFINIYFVREILLVPFKNMLAQIAGRVDPPIPIWFPEFNPREICEINEINERYLESRLLENPFAMNVASLRFHDYSSSDDNVYIISTNEMRRVLSRFARLCGVKIKLNSMMRCCT